MGTLSIKQQSASANLVRIEKKKIFTLECGIGVLVSTVFGMKVTLASTDLYFGKDSVSRRVAQQGHLHIFFSVPPMPLSLCYDGEDIQTVEGGLGLRSHWGFGR